MFSAPVFAALINHHGDMRGIKSLLVFFLQGKPEIFVVEFFHALRPLIVFCGWCVFLRNNSGVGFYRNQCRGI